MKKAVVFPGQGAQYVGMGKEFYERYSESKRIFSLADEVLGYRISDICFNGPEEKLKDTGVQQLAILTVSCAIFEACKEHILKDTLYLAGLSLGEYTALYAGGVLEFSDLIILVRERAEAMQQASLLNPSCMLAVIGLDIEVLRSNNSLGFYIANVNSPNQIVVSVHKDKKEEIKDRLISLGAKRVVELRVSGGFHSPFMEPAKDRLEKVLEKMTFKEASIPIVSNFDAQPYTSPEKIKDNLLNQLTHTVLWKECVEFMAQSVDTFVEIGPSKVLTGLIRKICTSPVVNLESLKDLEVFVRSSL